MELRSVLETLVSPWSTEHAAMKARLLEEYRSSREWSQEVIPFILYVTYRGPPCYSPPDYLIRCGDFGFLKKATARSNDDSAEVMKGIAQRLNDQCDFDLYFEVAEVTAEVGV